ncbi:MAG TPA: hypothetical protein VIA18_32805 [Polyangia bacterium]|nr:hypothetical protein [Polyangia bacterium]
MAAALLLLTTAAHANSRDAAKAEARGHYDAGLAHFNLREYPQAITEFQAAYRALPDPVFLYNLAQSYRLSDAPEQALYFYQTYLRSTTNAPDRAEVEDRIAALQKVIADKKSAPRAAPAEPKTEATVAPAVVVAPTVPAPAPLATSAADHSRSDRKPIYKRWWLWTVVGVVLVGTGVGVGVGLGTQKSAHFNANVGTFGPSALTVRF